MANCTITILVAGTNEPSNSNVLADTFMEGMQQYEKVQVYKRRLKDMQIEHFTLEDYQPDQEQEADFLDIQQCIEKSDAFVIATPIWNFGVPAHLKNLVDKMGRFALDETRRKGTLNWKPFYIIYTGGAPMGAWLSMMQFTTSFIHEALEYFGATYLGRHYEERCVPGPGEFGLVVDQRPESLQNVRKAGYAFIGDVRQFVTTGRVPWRQRLKRYLMRKGEAIMKHLG